MGEATTTAAFAGHVYLNGFRDGPPLRLAAAYGDHLGALFTLYGIMMALRVRERTGQGQYLDVSMMDTLVSMMFMENLEEAIAEGLPLRTGNISRSGPTGLYETKNGDVSLTVTSDDQWGRLSRAMGAPELLEDPRFSDYVARTVNVEDARKKYSV